LALLVGDHHLHIGRAVVGVDLSEHILDAVEADQVVVVLKMSTLRGIEALSRAIENASKSRACL
jgi:hypothetical protein